MIDVPVSALEIHRQSQDQGYGRRSHANERGCLVDHYPSTTILVPTKRPSPRLTSSTVVLRQSADVNVKLERSLMWEFSFEVEDRSLSILLCHPRTCERDVNLVVYAMYLMPKVRHSHLPCEH